MPNPLTPKDTYGPAAALMLGMGIEELTPQQLDALHTWVFSIRLAAVMLDAVAAGEYLMLPPATPGGGYLFREASEQQGTVIRSTVHRCIRRDRKRRRA